MHFRQKPASTRCGIAFATMALLIVPAAGSAWAQEQGQVFVANYIGDSVTMWSLNTTGNRAPVSTILEPVGASPHQIAINHRTGEIIVANNVAYTVSVFDRATGTLKRTIGGPSSGIIRPTGVAIDETRGEIYVANDWAHSITVYDELATGDAAPKRTITSAALFAPVGLVIDIVHDELLVADYSNNVVLTFDRTASGDVNPKRQLAGNGLALPQGIALDVIHDEIIVANSAFATANAGSILAFNRTDNWPLITPPRKIEGAATGLCNPFSVAVDFIKDQIVVANTNFGSGTCGQAITTYSRAATGNVLPVRAIAGTATTLNYPTSAAIFYGGTLGLANKPASTTITPGTAATYNFTASANGGSVLNANVAFTLSGAASWGVSGTDAGACTIAGTNQLTCSFGNLLKGQTKSIKLSATPPQGSCAPISNQAVASYINGDAFLTASSAATVSIKCK